MEGGSLTALADLAVDGVLAGKYQVERVLGTGGMGLVVAAQHIQLDEKVAIKLLLPGMTDDVAAVDRFLSEARAAAKIKSEHVVRVHDVGTLESGAPYMVMEYLEGIDLAEWLWRSGRLEVDQAVEFVLQACEAVAEAHSLGIIHRDLKPSNLFCVRRPDGELSIKVLDFGISKATRAVLGAGAVTTTNTSLGSPLYMSPEQMKSARDVDARTDVWSLGVILYELVAGAEQVPFPGSSVPEIAINAATQTPVPLRQHWPDVPRALENVIDRCLEKAPAARFADVGELAVALLELATPRARVSVERIQKILDSARVSQQGAGSGPLPRESVGAATPGRLPASSSPVSRTSNASADRQSAASLLDSWSSPRLVASVAIVALGVIVLMVAAAVSRLHAKSEPTSSASPPASAQLATTASEQTHAASQLPDDALAALLASAASSRPTNNATTAEASAEERAKSPPSAAPRPTSTTPPPRPGNRPPTRKLPLPTGSAQPGVPVASAPVDRPSPAPASAASSNCDPPYYYAPNGTRVFRKECPL